MYLVKFPEELYAGDGKGDVWFNIDNIANVRENIMHHGSDTHKSANLSRQSLKN